MSAARLVRLTTCVWVNPTSHGIACTMVECDRNHRSWQQDEAKKKDAIWLLTDYIYADSNCKVRFNKKSPVVPCSLDYSIPLTLLKRTVNMDPPITAVLCASSCRTKRSNSWQDMVEALIPTWCYVSCQNMRLLVRPTAISTILWHPEQLHDGWIDGFIDSCHHSLSSQSRQYLGIVSRVSKTNFNHPLRFPLVVRQTWLRNIASPNGHLFIGPKMSHIRISSPAVDGSATGAR